MLLRVFLCSDRCAAQRSGWGGPFTQKHQIQKKYLPNKRLWQALTGILECTLSCTPAQDAHVPSVREDVDGARLSAGADDFDRSRGMRCSVLRGGGWGLSGLPVAGFPRYVLVDGLSGVGCGLLVSCRQIFLSDCCSDCFTFFAEGLHVRGTTLIY